MKFIFSRAGMETTVAPCFPTKTRRYSSMTYDLKRARISYSSRRHCMRTADTVRISTGWHVSRPVQKLGSNDARLNSKRCGARNPAAKFLCPKYSSSRITRTAANFEALLAAMRGLRNNGKRELQQPSMVGAVGVLSKHYRRTKKRARRSRRLRS